jgi:hypothetical protein
MSKMGTLSTRIGVNHATPAAARADVGTPVRRAETEQLRRIARKSFAGEAL